LTHPSGWRNARREARADIIMGVSKMAFLPAAGGILFRSGKKLLGWLRFIVSEIMYIQRYILPPLVLSYYYGLSLHQVSGHLAPKSAKSTVAVVTYYGNKELLTSFLRYYRRLGVDDFVFLDLSRQQPLAELLRGESRCAVWRPRGSVSPRLGIHWLNFLRRRYGTGRWCLSVEPSEFLVFPHSETRDIHDLTEFLASEQRDHLFALVLEMYADRPASAVSLAPDDNPFEVLPYFDPVGYACRGTGRLRSVPTQGGVQRRTLFANTPQNAPALNRIPLIRWRWYYSYVAGSRLAVPGWLNTAHSTWHLNPTACLLRCALLDDVANLVTAEGVERTVLVSDGATPSYPGLVKLRDLGLRHSASARFGSSQDLLRWGLLNLGQWF
jgi:hypothetical protein